MTSGCRTHMLHTRGAIQLVPRDDHSLPAIPLFQFSLVRCDCDGVYFYRLKALEDEAYDVYEANLSAAEKASEKRTKKQRAKADKAEAQADAAAAEMEAKREREAALDRNKDRLREENRTKLEARLEQLLEGEAQMSLERKRE